MREFEIKLIFLVFLTKISVLSPGCVSHRDTCTHVHTKLPYQKIKPLVRGKQRACLKKDLSLVSFDPEIWAVERP